MRISVECGGFTEAADSCRTGNQVAALLTESLSGRLASCAGMAGNDATSLAFASSYDAGAREALATLTDITHAFIGLGRLIAASGANHRDAEAASADGLSVNAYVGGGLDDDSYLRVSPAPPPSCRGAQEPSLGPVDRWILDQVEGFVWPGADLDRLHQAAFTWRSAAGSLADLTDHLAIAGSFLADQRSPEIPLALDAIDELRSLINDAASHLVALGDACEDYADAVDATRQRTLALLAEIGKMIVEGIAVSAVVAGITGGLAGSAAASAALSRITAQTPRFRTLQATLLAATTTTGSRLRTAHHGLTLVRTRVEKFTRIPARGDRGAMKNPLGWGRDRGPGWLRAHEVPPAHTLEKHVGKSIEDLVEQCRRDKKRFASSFASETDAEHMVDEVLRNNASQIKEWLRSGSRSTLPLEDDLGKVTGTTVSKAGDVSRPTGVRVVLMPSNDSDGWRVLTAFPN